MEGPLSPNSLSWSCKNLITKNLLNFKGALDKGSDYAGVRRFIFVLSTFFSTLVKHQASA